MLQAVVLIHVMAGALAVLLGAVAASTRKGGRVHIAAGRWFVLLMTVASLFGAVLGLIRFEQYFITFFAGMLGAYLVVSGWLTAKARDGKLGKPTLALALLNAFNFAALLTIGVGALLDSDGRMFGFAGEDYLFLAGMSAIGLLFDFSLLFRQPLSTNPRTARHLWRMLLGFFIAAGSAFTGPGAKAFPDWIQQSGVLSAPELLIIILMAYYLLRTSFSRPKAQSTNTAAAVCPPTACDT